MLGYHAWLIANLLLDNATRTGEKNRTGIKTRKENNRELRETTPLEKEELAGLRQPGVRR